MWNWEVNARTLNRGEAASVQTSFDGTSVYLAFGIPRGADGTPVTSFRSWMG